MKPTYKEIEQQLSESRREFWAADATINNLEMKLADMAEQLANAEKRIAELESLTVPQLPQPAQVSVPEVVGWEDVPEEITEDDIALASAWAIGFNQCRAAMLKLLCDSEQLDEVGSWNNHRNTPTAQASNHTEQYLDIADHSGDATKKPMLHFSEPETDNTNQQFESLGRGDK